MLLKLAWIPNIRGHPHLQTAALANHYRKAWNVTKIEFIANRKPSDAIYRSPFNRYFLTIGDIRRSRIAERHRRRRWRAAATAVADAHWCSDAAGVRAYCRYLLRMIFLDTQCSLTPPAVVAAAAAAEVPPPHCMFSVSDPNGFQCAAFPSCYCVLWLLPPVLKDLLKSCVCM